MKFSTGGFAKIHRGAQFAKIAGLGVPTGAVAVCIVVAILIIWPKFNEILRLREANQELESKVQSLEEKSQKLASLNKNELTEQLAKAEMLLPSDKDLFVFIRQLEIAAGTTGVLVDKVDIGSPGLVGKDSGGSLGSTTPGGQGQTLPGTSSGDIAPKIQFRLSIRSDYRSAITFLRSLLNIPRTLEIKDLTISSGGSSTSSSNPTSSGQVTLNFAINAFWKSIPSELASIETPLKDLTLQEVERLKKIKLREAEALTPKQIEPVPLGREDLFAPF